MHAVDVCIHACAKPPKALLIATLGPRAPRALRPVLAALLLAYIWSARACRT